MPHDGLFGALVAALGSHARRTAMDGRPLRIPKGIFLCGSDPAPGPGYVYIGSWESVAQLPNANRSGSTSIFVIVDASAKPFTPPAWVENYVETDLPLSSAFNIVFASTEAFLSREDAADEQEHSLAQFLSGRGPLPLELRDYCEEATVGGSHRCSIVLLDSEQPIGPGRDLLLRAAARELLPGAPIASIGRRLAIVMRHSHTVSGDGVIDEQFRELLQRHSAFAGVSGPTTRADMLDVLYAVTAQILRTVSTLPVIKRRLIYSQDEFGVYFVFELFRQQFSDTFGRRDVRAVAHPGIAALDRYDRENHTDLRETLFTYLVNNQNLTLTAEQLYSHRNTVYNKIKKIRDIIGDDLTDGKVRLSLELSHLLLRYHDDAVDPFRPR